ncbi:DUF397 domain-containing protein [Actinomadura roseirufa]|uniref:DUF397 domain-containing protein n=1 Tax=Actinomadura roseirufa TaxID=2094049 RepID=UPI0010415DC2|nr:DUF397 domain-containing protein [Actinomadura roseirufa]
MLPNTTTWRRSSHSGDNGGDCVELAGLPGGVAVRDSKDPDGPALIVTRACLHAALEEGLPAQV